MLYTIIHFRKPSSFPPAYSTLFEALEAAIEYQIQEHQGIDPDIPERDLLMAVNWSDAQTINQISKFADGPEGDAYDVRAYIIHNEDPDVQDKVYIVAGPTEKEEFLVVEVSVDERYIQGDVFNWMNILVLDDVAEEWHREWDAVEQREGVDGIEPWRQVEEEAEKTEDAEDMHFESPDLMRQKAINVSAFEWNRNASRFAVQMNRRDAPELQRVSER